MAKIYAFEALNLWI